MEINKASNKIFYLNIVYLFISKVVNYTFPFFILIYLISKIGLHNYGKVSFAQANVYYFQLFCEFGFAFAGTKQIVDASNSLREKSEVISSIYTAMSVFVVISLIVITGITFFVPQYNELQGTIFYFFLASVFFVFTPLWYYQGIQSVKNITLVNVISKVFFAGGITVLIQKEGDYTYYPIIYAISNAIPFVYANYIMLVKHKIRLQINPFDKVMTQIKYSKDFFVGTLASGAFYSNITILLGFLTNETVVGIYNAAEKLIKALATISSPISQALFPNVSEKSKINMSEATSFSLRVGIISSVVVGLLSIISFFLVPILVVELPFLTKQFGQSMIVFQLMCLFPAIDTFMHTFCSQQLITFNLQNKYSLSYIIGICVNLVVGYIFIQLYGLNGASMVLFITEIFMCGLMSYFIFKKIKELDIKLKVL